MKQIIQNIRTGETLTAEVPAPRAREGALLIASLATLVSPGTERMLLDFGKASMLSKARQQPDKVRMVLNKFKSDGVGPTIASVRNKLDQPLPLGYSNVGIVIGLGSSVSGWKLGDRVVSNGPHAEIVCSPSNLCAKVPATVSDEAAAFTVVGAIGLQGVRLIHPAIGENIVVIGLGLIGLLTVQILRANGCNVLGVDPEMARCKIAASYGVEVCCPTTGDDPLDAATRLSNGRGVDGVVITASTRSNSPIHQAATMCRKRGRIVLVGVTGLELSRSEFYEKELTFQVSCSYGPGRYDRNFEEKGLDYPFGLVRWTEQRNFEAILELLAANRLNVSDLISHRFSIEDASSAYQVLSETESLGIVLNYPERADRHIERGISLSRKDEGFEPSDPIITMVGAGNYATQSLIPAFKKTGANLHTLVSEGGLSSVHHGKKHGFKTASTDASASISGKSVSVIVVATRHDSHADYVLQGVRAGKDVFVEKPLCLNLDDLSQIQEEMGKRSATRLMVGFNRRFSPLSVKTKELITSVQAPKAFIMSVNAGMVPAEHWTQDREIGGGRIVGEACHFIDLLRFFADSPIADFDVWNMHDQATKSSDTTSLVLQFNNGSHGVIHYFANGHRGYPKERLEVFCAGRILQLDNFRRLKGWGWKGFKSVRLRRQDKGQAACIEAFIKAIRNGDSSPIPLDEIFEVARVSIEAQEQLF